MELPQIRIQSQSFLLGLNIKQPIQQLEQKPADLQIDQAKIDLYIRTKPTEMRLDSTEARADVGLISARRSIEEAANKGYDDWLAGIARMSSEGDRMMNIHENSKAIPTISKQNGTPPQAETVLTFIPKYGSLKTTWIPHETKIDWKQTPMNLDVQVNKPVHNYTPGKVGGYILQESELNIEFTGVTIDIKK